MSKLRVAVLISGRGSNLQALIDACADPAYPATIVRVIADRASAKGLQRAADAGIETLIVDFKEYDSKEDFEDALHAGLTDAKAEFVCLAGFMRILNADFVGRWKNRMINIHPSLLPAYRGLQTHERVLEDGVRFTGCTIHYVRPEMDDGPILMQAVIPVLPEDTPASLAKRVLTQEHRLYPAALRMVAEGKARVSGARVIFKDVAFPEDSVISPAPSGNEPASDA